MTNGPGAGNAPPATYPAGPSGNLMPRRSSYASVLSGTATQQQQQHQQQYQQHYPNNTPPARAGAFADLIYAGGSSSYPPQSVPDHRYQRQFSGQDPDPNPSSWHSWRKGTQLPPHSRKFAGIIGKTMPNSLTATSFFVPSYLRNSRYMAKLEAAHQAKLAAQREAALNPASLPTSSASNATPHRMAPSHRGMTYDIIENAPLADDDKLTPLPSRWSETDKHQGLELFQDGMEIRYNGPSNKAELVATAARADQPMSPACGIYYFEVEIRAKSKDGMIAVGFSSRKASLERLPGWESETWAYHGDDGKSYFGEGTNKTYGHTFGANDVIGCGVNFASGCAFFTKNGRNLGTAFKDLKGIRAFPAVGIKQSPGSCVSVNFGQKPFIFDIDDMVAQQRLAVDREIDATPISSLSLDPPMDESMLAQELVARFLSHDGYVETAKAFAQEVKARSRPLDRSDPTGKEEPVGEEDFDAANRQRIRASILDGDIDQTFKHTIACYPHVLDDNPEIVFRLKCRRYVEMIRRCSELQHAPPSPSPAMTPLSSKSANNGHTDVFDEDMELDDGQPFHLYKTSTQHQPEREDDSGSDEEEEEEEEGDDEEEGPDEDDDDETEADYHDESSDPARYDDLLQEAMAYGRTLMLEYRDEKREYRKALDDIFSLIAYDDAKSSVHGHLLDPGERALVAEELNAAILVSLGRSSSAALERLYQQTEALISDLSSTGGPAALVNVRDVFSL